MLNFTISDIQKIADSATFQRGLEYFKQKRVKMLAYDEASETFNAQVKGRGRNRYEVDVFMTEDGLTSICTCPVTLDCKHGVAAALHWLSIKPKDVEPSNQIKQANAHNKGAIAWREWLDALPSSGHSATLTLIPSRFYLLYFLHKTASDQWYLDLRKAYLRQDGKWSQISRYTPEPYSLIYRAPEFMFPIDVQILRLLMGCAQSPSGFQIEGEAGAFLLDQVLRTERMYWMGTSNSVFLPIQLLPTTSLSWHWEEGDEGQHLLPEIQGVSDWEILPVNPPRYMDLERKGIGALQSLLDSQQITHLLQLPPIEPAQMAEFSATLRCYLTPEQVPLPEELDTVIENTPTPCLRVFVGEVDGGVILPGALVAFEYGGYRVDLDLDAMISTHPEVCVQNGKTYLVQRDVTAEEVWLQQLLSYELGLVRRMGGFHDVWVPKNPNGSQMLHDWQTFMETGLPALQAQGWQIEIDPDYALPVQSAAFDIHLRDGKNNWFNFALNLPVDDERSLSTQDIVAQWLEEGSPDELCLPLTDGWIRIDTKPLKSLYSLILELYSQNKLDKPVSLPPFQAAQLADTLELDERQAPLTTKLVKQLKNYAGLVEVPLSMHVQAQLRPYQQQGLNWLGFLQQYGFGGILADDMGLGKTLQTLSLIQGLKDNKRLYKRPVLVVAPTSLMGNWQREAAQFTPELKTCLIHGLNRAKQFDQISKCDLVITSYPLLLRDADRYKKRKFSLLVLDEAQAIKNPNTKVAQQVRALDAGSRLCLTGTPLENHLGELWALMDFAMPGLLGGLKSFNQFYRQPIEQEGDRLSQQALAKRVAPFMLRRTKTDVVQELPAKTEIIQYVQLEGQQRELYESIRISMEQRIRQLVATKGLARSHIEFLDALLKLRQACIDPRLVKLDKAAQIEGSAKLDWLRDTLPELLDEGRRVLIFSQFTAVLGLLEVLLKELNVEYSKLTGQTRKRQEAIDRFQSGDVPVFLISLKAGGSGLNLTAADTVIHLDPWWNPAVEQQATDRAYRIGQDKPVFVYKLVAADTVEERIQQMQQQKQALADALFDETGRAGMPTDQESLLALLA